jgi:hypothetical protein
MIRSTTACALITCVIALAALATDPAVAAPLVVDAPGDFTLSNDINGNGTPDPGDTVTWEGTPRTPGLIFGTTAFGSIQAAIDAANPGATVRIADGTYVASNTTIDKPLTLVGESRGGVILAPAAVDDHDPGGTFDGAFQHGLIVAADGVTIRRLTIDGEANTALSPNDRNFRCGIVTADGTENERTTVIDCTIRNIRRRGVQIWAAATGGHLVAETLVEQVERRDGIFIYGTGTVRDCNIRDVNLDIGTPGQPVNGSAVRIFTNGEIRGCAIADAQFGIVTDGDATIVDNTIDRVAAGIVLNNSQYGVDVSDVSVRGNTITNILGGSASHIMFGIGMSVVNLGAGSVIGGADGGDRNVIDLTGTATPGAIGIYCWWNPEQLTIEGNEIRCTGDQAGVWLQHNEVDASDPRAPAAVPVTLRGNVFSATGSSRTQAGEGTAIWVSSNGTNNGNSLVRIQGNRIDGFHTGIEAETRPGNMSGGELNTVEVVIEAGVWGETEITDCEIGVALTDGDGATDGRLADLTVTGGLEVRNCDVGLSLQGGDASVGGAVIRNCTTGIDLSADVAVASLAGNTITDNGTGIRIAASIGSVAGLAGNDLSDNTVGLDSDAAVDAAGNWWGAAAGPGAGYVTGAGTIDTGAPLPRGDDEGGVPGMQVTRYVDDPADFTLTNDVNGNSIPDPGDEVTWNGQSTVRERVFGLTAFGSIQAAIDAASFGDVIRVAPGTYAETVVIPHGLTLLGDPGSSRSVGPGPDAPVLDGSTLGMDVEAITLADGVTNVTVAGFRIRDYEHAGGLPSNGVAVSAIGSNGSRAITIRHNEMQVGLSGGSGWALIHVWNQPMAMHRDWRIEYNRLEMGPSDTANRNVYVIELTNVVDSVVRHNEISGGWHGISVTVQDQSGMVRDVRAGNLTIERNTIRDTENQAVALWGLPYGSGTLTLSGVAIRDNTIQTAGSAIGAWSFAGSHAVEDLTIEGNTITITNPDESRALSEFAAVTLRDVGGTSVITDNEVTLAGSLNSGSDFHGVVIAGGRTGSVRIADMTMTGGDGAGGADSAGVRLTGLPAGAAIEIEDCTIGGFISGIRIDTDVTPGASVIISGNDLSGNTSFAINSLPAGFVVLNFGNDLGDLPSTGTIVDFPDISNGGGSNGGCSLTAAGRTDGGTAILLLATALLVIIALARRAPTTP